MITASAYDIHVEELFDRMKRLHAALSGAGIVYRIIGGMAVYLHVSERDPGKARLTRDVDVAVNRGEFERIAAAAVPFGFQFRCVAGVDMLLDNAELRAGSSINLVFAGEKVRPEYSEPVPDFSEPTRTAEGILIAPVADLVRMKLGGIRFTFKIWTRWADHAGDRKFAAGSYARAVKESAGERMTGSGTTRSRGLVILMA